jgi:hypothetical protein
LKLDDIQLIWRRWSLHLACSELLSRCLPFHRENSETRTHQMETIIY